MLPDAGQHRELPTLDRPALLHAHLSWSYRTQLQRHGARYPTDGPSGNIQDAVKKLQDAGPYTGNATFGFIDAYTYTLGLDDLVPYGAAQYVTPCLQSPVAE